MHNLETRVQELLACHGSDVERWPEESKDLWLEAQRHPKCVALIQAEAKFERFLMKRGVPAPSRDLAARIMNASLARPQIADVTGWLSDLLSEVRPAALAAMLVLGFAIGFGIVSHAPSLKDSAVVRAFSDDDGTIL